LDWTDWLSYLYLGVGLFTLFAPIVWLLMSSLKTESALSQFPPTFLPYSQKMVTVAGHDKPLPLFTVRQADGSLRDMAQLRRIGIMATTGGPDANRSRRCACNIDIRTASRSTS